MISLDPIHYIAAGALVVCIGLGIYNRILSAELETAQTINKTTKVIGDVQNALTKKEDQKSKEVKENLDEKYNKTITDLQSTNKRLLNSIASSSKLPRSTQVCTGGGEREEVNWPLINQALLEFKQEVGVLIGEGDQATAALDTVKDWILRETN
jgi:hypothetical protein